MEEGPTRQYLRELEAKYQGIAKARCPHPDIGDWWALYDYGAEAIRTWPLGFQPPYPEDLKRRKDKEAHKAAKAERRHM